MRCRVSLLVLVLSACGGEVEWPVAVDRAELSGTWQPVGTGVTGGGGD